MLSIIPVKQKKNYWCGPTSLKMVLNYYGIDKTEKELARICQASPALGVPAQKLVDAAKSFGLRGFVKDNCEFSDIAHYVCDKKIPVIVDWFQIDDGHYSVVTDINDKYIYLTDPYQGEPISIKKTKFYRVWFDFPGLYLQQKQDLILRRIIVIYS